ncbi:hypothetical protein ACFVXE_11810 [Streptomyces sp. NPDC058231]|uniref:hypothetical protein n=1 Tax=Streptomyces sp. NPDC058231 TaxID=3346392 RepID=UPI0036EA96EB
MRTWVLPHSQLGRYVDRTLAALDQPQQPAPEDRAKLREQYGQVLRRWGLLDEVNDPQAAERFAVTDLLAVPTCRPGPSSSLALYTRTVNKASAVTPGADHATDCQTVGLPASKPVLCCAAMVGMSGRQDRTLE